MVLLIRNYSTSQPSGTRCSRVCVLDASTPSFQSGSTVSNPVGGTRAHLSYGYARRDLVLARATGTLLLSLAIVREPPIALKVIVKGVAVPPF